MYTKPSFNSLNTFSLVVFFINAGSFINSSDKITARKLKAFNPKQTPSPNFSITRPAIAGPSSLDRLTIEEFKARALGKSFLSSTIS